MNNKTTTFTTRDLEDIKLRMLVQKIIDDNLNYNDNTDTSSPSTNNITFYYKDYGSGS